MTGRIGLTCLRIVAEAYIVVGFAMIAAGTWWTRRRRALAIAKPD